MKTIVMSRRRPELTRDAFREYYETQHAPLAIQHVRFTKYVRNHLIAPSNAEFDVVSEFWLVDPKVALELDNTAAGETLGADADTFIGQPRLRAIAEESLLAGPPRRYETGRVQKYALLLNRRAYAAEADFIADARDWGRRLAQSAAAKRVTIDVVKPFPGGRFPANAFLWLWLDRAFDVGLADTPPKAARSPTVWSEGMISISGLGSASIKAKAAIHAAGAVLRPTGSSKSARGITEISRSCSAMMNRCSSLATSKGGANPWRPATRQTVCCSRLSRPRRPSSCFG